MILFGRTFAGAYRKIAREFLIFLFLVWFYLGLDFQTLFVFETNHFNYFELFYLVNIRFFLGIDFFGIKNCRDLFIHHFNKKHLFIIII